MQNCTGKPLAIAAFQLLQRIHTQLFLHIITHAKYDLEETAKELAAAQMALDLANTTVEFDVEI